jgi:hypothetical protein
MTKEIVNNNAKTVAEVFSEKYIYNLNKFEDSSFTKLAYNAFYNLAMEDIEKHILTGNKLEDWSNYSDVAELADDLIYLMTKEIE